ncbi:alpha-amylase [Lineolata rhizophorae]|uniref:alpha-amylase n=1 Tax=Lineolata rhizophorae TaxID=578093 RepID=A0A6A6P497_9PEZI|nr:alpha-amylase [Lineolata rhizophorae]
MRLQGSTKTAAAIAVACCSVGVHAAGADEWRSRSIYQLLTDRFARTDGSTTAECNTEDALYCGGTYSGLIKKLDYIQDMGFSAVWISPPVKNLEGTTAYGEAFHGYWQQDIYSLNPHFGTPDELRELSDELHDRGMYLMVDIVVNHMAWPGPADSVDYDDFYPFNSDSYYHSFCDITNYDDQDMVEDCWLGDSNVELVDVKTEDENIQQMYNEWIAEFVANYTIDGLRIDTVKHVEKDFFPDFLDAAGIFATGEVFDGDPQYVCDYQNYMDSVLNYPIWYPLTAAFQSTSGSISDLVSTLDLIKDTDTCGDPTLLCTFAENHDVARFASLTSDLSLAKNILAFVLLSDGIPIVYAGQEQHYAGDEDPDNREAVWLSGYNTEAPLYKMTATLNAVRNLAVTSNSSYLEYRNWIVYSDESVLAMRKGYDGIGQVVTVLNNQGEDGGEYDLSIGQTGWEEGTSILEVLGCVQATAGSEGMVTVAMAGGEPKVYFAEDSLRGSGICGR